MEGGRGREQWGQGEGGEVGVGEVGGEEVFRTAVLEVAERRFMENSEAIYLDCWVDGFGGGVYVWRI